ncbi:unnamed protein product, partial [Chrysoparadoxa australica]
LSDQKAACTGAHQQWDDELNSCMTKQEAITVREETESCADSEDPEKCYMDKAQSLTGVKKGDRYKEDSTENLAKMIAGAYAMFTLIAMVAARGASKGGSDPGGTCTSKYIFWGTSLAWLAGDYFLKKKAKDKFKDMAKKYDAEANNENVKGEAGSYAAQVRAFHYLKQEQEAIKDQAKARKKLQVGVMVGFAASAGFAAYE